MPLNSSLKAALGIKKKKKKVCDCWESLAGLYNEKRRKGTGEV